MTLIDCKRNFPDWDAIYSNDVTKMPWYEKNLDPDVKCHLDRMGLEPGRFLDIGTGPGTQAVWLDRLGFTTTGSDISQNAISKAQRLPGNVDFVVDNILDSAFPDGVFDYVLDRGCFHVIYPHNRKDYLGQVRRIMKGGGLVFLKVMSSDEVGLFAWERPYRFSRQDIAGIFGQYFEILEIQPTVFHGTLDPPPRALFAVLQKRDEP